MDVQNYVKHAQKYGTEGVLEAAAEAGNSLSFLVRLQGELEQIEDAAARARRFGTVKRRRGTLEERTRKLLGIEPDGEEKAA